MKIKHNSCAEYLISIIITVFNAEEYLAERFEKLLSQNLDYIQLIIVNDGSTDTSDDICRNYFSCCSDVVYIMQKNQGLSIARNNGINAADGEYILFLDSDDIILDNCLDIIRTYLKKNKPDVLMGKYVIICNNKYIIKPNYTFPNVNSASEARLVIYSSITDSIWNAWRYICSRLFLVNNNLYFLPGIICEDLEWTPRVLGVASCIYFIDEPFYGYFYNRPGSITREAVAKRVVDVNTIVANNVTKYISEEYGRAIVFRLIRESFLCISRYCLCDKDVRKELRPIINDSVCYYYLSKSIIIKIFLLTRNIIPLYVWSLILWFMKRCKDMFKNYIGPTTIKLKL